MHDYNYHRPHEALGNVSPIEFLKKYITNAKLLICIFAYHHRLTWVHPFLDGNGRISRLLLDLSLRKTLGGNYGVWNISRGLARDSDKYKTMLNNADMPRFRDFDGRVSID